MNRILLILLVSVVTALAQTKKPIYLQIDQNTGKILGLPGELAFKVANSIDYIPQFANDAARLAATPSYVGQIGYQIDSAALWRGQNTSVGGFSGSWRFGGPGVTADNLITTNDLQFTAGSANSDIFVLDEDWFMKFEFPNSLTHNTQIFWPEPAGSDDTVVLRNTPETLANKEFDLGNTTITGQDTSADWFGRVLDPSGVGGGLVFAQSPNLDSAALTGTTLLGSVNLKLSEVAPSVLRTEATASNTLAQVQAGNIAGHEPRGRTLSAMSLQRTVSSITGVSSGISGATYNQRTGTLFLVRNVSGAAGTIYEVRLDGSVVRTITNSNFIDTEAVEWVGCFGDPAGVGGVVGAIYDILLVSEEDHTTAANEESLTLCLLASNATTLDRTAVNSGLPDNVTTTTAYSGGTIANGGIESVCFDPYRSRIYYTAEFRTQLGSDNTAYASGAGQAKIFKRDIVANSTTLSFGAESTLCSIIGLFTTPATGTLYNSGTPASPYDIGDMAYDAADDKILLQSDTGDRIVKIDLQGNAVDWLITTGNQPEGLAIHPDGNLLWMVGEAQELFQYGSGSNPRSILPNVLSASATLDFASTGAAAIADLTITVTGASVGDPCIVVPPTGSITATATFTSWVSAANTVTVRFSPKATEDPASGSFRAVVFKP